MLSEYRRWLSAPVHVNGLTLLVSSKPGVMAHGQVDQAAAMIAGAISELSGNMLRPHSRSVHLGAGNGLVPAVAALNGYSVAAFDRSIVNVAATTKTLNASLAHFQAVASAATSAVANSDCSPLRLAPRPNESTPADSPEVPPAAAVHHAVIPGPLVSDQSAELVTIHLPTDRIGAEMAIAEAFRVLAPGGICLLSGANNTGAKPAVRLLGEVFGNASVVAQKAGFRLAQAVRADSAPTHAVFNLPWLNPCKFHETPLNWKPANAPERVVKVFSRPGVFSWEHLDEATELMLSCMDIQQGERVLDLGCGAGVLGTVAAIMSGAPTVLVDADADAVRCATKTSSAAELSNVSVRASDVAAAVDGEKFDVVVTNPPFHIGKSTDLALPEAFIDEAYGALGPGGRLILVANRTLPYERLINSRFSSVRVLHDGQRFKVLGARRD